jgi:simple sugar transport system permease protein
LSTTRYFPHRERSVVLFKRAVPIALSLIFIVALALGLTALISHVSNFPALVALPTFWGVLLVNGLVGGALILFVLENGRGTLRILLTVTLALLIGFGITLLISKDPVKAYTALLTGPLTRINRWGAWIEDALSLTLVGLAIAIVFRARLFSLGAEGQIYLGALAAGLIALNVHGLPPGMTLLLAVAAACLAGFLWGLLPGALRAYLDANELVSTLMLNEVATRAYSLVLNAIRPPDAGFTVSATFPADSVFVRFINGTKISTAIGFVILAIFLCWLLIQRMPFGFAIRMMGANPNFARYGGINTRRTIMLTMAISGIVAGLAGAYLALSIQQKLIVGISSGLAFEGIVVALLARNNVLAVPAMALLYAYLRAGAQIMQLEADVSLEIVRVIQAIIILLVTAEFGLEFLRVRRVDRRRPNGAEPATTEKDASLSGEAA